MSGRIFKKEIFAERLLELMESNGDTVYSIEFRYSTSLYTRLKALFLKP